MPTNHMLYYMPGLTFDQPIPVELAAADWHIFVQWLYSQDSENLESVAHITHLIFEQVTTKLYTPSSLKAAQATAAQHREESDLSRIVHSMQFADATEKWVIKCANCGEEGEYDIEHGGPLNCGHNGSRSVVRIIMYPSAEE